MSKTDPAGEQRVSDELLAQLILSHRVFGQDVTVTFLLELQHLRTQSAAAAEERRELKNARMLLAQAFGDEGITPQWKREAVDLLRHAPLAAPAAAVEEEK